MVETYWLPKDDGWRARLRTAEQAQVISWADVVALAGVQLDFLEIERLDRLVTRAFPAPPPELSTAPVRLAMLGSSTTAHLSAAIRIAGLRQGLWIAIHEDGYGQYHQSLLGRSPDLEAFAPTIVLLALDARHVSAGVRATATVEEADEALAHEIGRIEACWQAARTRFGAIVLQQDVLAVLPTNIGSNEMRLPGSASRMVDRLNAALVGRANAERGVHLLAINPAAARNGLRHWHDPVLWHRAKQEVSPAAAPIYGELVARLLGAIQGRSAKCLVLDLDNTLWGGVIGDDGLNGIVLGQGSALGEAFVAVQAYARDLARRGVILAVCSKNDEAVALSVFEQHPGMILRRDDISCFVANWRDKAQNLRAIAAELNLGLDALVLVDDNPFERNLIRDVLPEVRVPEIPDDDPALVPQLLADAGYFESVAITPDDLVRTQHYRANRLRGTAQADASDLPAYLRGLDMTLAWCRFRPVDLGRVVQLVNKTNQFNLTTRRLTTADVQAILDDDRRIGLQFRLTDRFGDNGIIAVVTASEAADGDWLIDDWLMSCRVLGREVERATLVVLAAQVRRLGGRRLIGVYRSTGRNGMVRDHYANLGFTRETADANHRFALPLESISCGEDLPIELVEEL